MTKQKLLGLLLLNGTILISISIFWFIPAPAGRSNLSIAPQNTERSPTTTEQNPLDDATAVVSQLVTPTLSQPVTDLPPVTESLDVTLDREINPRFALNPNGREPTYPIVPDPLLQQSRAPQAISSFNTPSLNFDGAPYGSANPPDVVGDIGRNHYIQMSNTKSGAQVNIYDKSGNALQATFMLETLGSNNCNQGKGDPIVLYDEAADRWLMSEFAYYGNHLCIYISQTADPQGAWYAYQFTTTYFPDYPKYAIWHDAYYIGVNEAQPSVFALERDKMLLGKSAQIIRKSIDPVWGGFDVMLPADIDGSAEPPADTPGLFMRQIDDDQLLTDPDPANDFLEIWAFTADFDTPANSTFTLIQSIPVAEFSSYFCSAGWYCVTQKGSSTKLDNLREPLMWRLQYRRFPEYAAITGNYVVNGDSNGQAAIRWFELRTADDTNWELHQEGTFAPNGHNYWMGSAAMDQSGNIALGYSIASNTLYPGLGYTGRLYTDTAGNMPYGDNSIIAGSSASSVGRWGDYQAMGIDPADGCTFWFTGQYIDSTSWNTRIASFRFPSCGDLLGSATISPAIATGEIGQPLTYTVSLTSTSPLTQTWSLTPNIVWSAVFTPTDVVLPPNGTGTAVVTVTMPFMPTDMVTESLQIDIVDQLGVTGMVTATAVVEAPKIVPATVAHQRGPTPTLVFDWADKPLCTTALYRSDEAFSSFGALNGDIKPLYEMVLDEQGEIGFYFIAVVCGSETAVSEKTGFMRFELNSGE